MISVWSKSGPLSQASEVASTARSTKTSEAADRNDEEEDEEEEEEVEEEEEEGTLDWELIISLSGWAAVEPLERLVYAGGLVAAEMAEHLGALHLTTPPE